MDNPLVPTGSDPVATLVFFLIVFAVVGAFFLFIHLVMGAAIRPNRPDTEKLTIYECGEPTVGSAWVQFDVRYYVVALLFVIFDVEVAFFFPWATMFGKANQLASLEVAEAKADGNLTDAEKKRRADIESQRRDLSAQLLPSGLTTKARIEMGLTKSVKTSPKEEIVPIPPDVAKKWAQVAFFDILLFFGILLVGFAYLWRRGDINWVRAYAHHKESAAAAEKPLEEKVAV